MMNIDFFKAVLDSEPSSVVVCDLNDTIVYMNPFAVKKYGKKEVLHGIDLEIEPGKIYGLIGRNGAGPNH